MTPETRRLRFPLWPEFLPDLKSSPV
ncbi:hypothetical protein MPLB_1710035 [Mesorhizobium sp. ORS 3324]|nr:hypothetical protein MPLB_1710035 [Mesorhizobium sp. ORS 3324]